MTQNSGINCFDRPGAKDTDDVTDDGIDDGLKRNQGLALHVVRVTDDYIAWTTIGLQQIRKQLHQKGTVSEILRYPQYVHYKTIKTRSG